MEYKLDTIAGVVFYGEYSFGTYTEVLSGYRINGIKKGSVTLGIRDDYEHVVKIYPNPLSKGTSLNFSEPVSDVIVYDVTGRIVMEGKDPALQELSAGTYIVEFNSSGKLYKDRLVIY